MALKHKKKKNTAIIYEQLISLATRLATQGKKNESNYVLEFIKSYFNPNTILGREKKLFDSYLKTKGADENQAKQTLEEIINQAKKLPQETLEKEKEKLIKEVKKDISSELHDIPIKNFKELASVQILFNEERNGYKHTDPQERVKIRNKLLENMTSPKNKGEELGIDNFTFKVLLNKFNEKYSKLLNESQAQLLKGWLNYLLTNNEDSFKSLLEKKLSDLKNTMESYEYANSLEDTETKSLIKEANENIKSLSLDNLNEELVYKVMRYFDVVDDIQKLEENNKDG